MELRDQCSRIFPVIFLRFKIRGSTDTSSARGSYIYKKTVRYFFTMLLATVFTGALAQTERIDLQKTDITILKSFDGKKAVFYGFHLGMSKKEAIDQLNSLQQFTWKFDAFNTRSESPSSTEEMRIYVNGKDPSGNGESTELFYLIWNTGSTELKNMVFFDEAAALMTGDTRKLFTTAALEPGSPLLRFLKSTPVYKEGITQTYSYLPEHFTLITFKNTAGDVKVRFKLIMQ